MIDTLELVPAHQPNPDRPVRFTLRPMTPVEWGRFQTLRTRAPDGETPDFDAMVDVFKAHVTAWEGLDFECTPEGKRRLLAEAPPMDVYLWPVQVAAHLFMQGLTKSAERKN